MKREREYREGKEVREEFERTMTALFGVPKSDDWKESQTCL